MSRTILFVQMDSNPKTRTYSIYESVIHCLSGVCTIYEDHLKRSNPNEDTIIYDIPQLFDFLDELEEIKCLVYQESTKTYVPHKLYWLKVKIYVLIRRAAEPSLIGCDLFLAE